MLGARAVPRESVVRAVGLVRGDEVFVVDRGKWRDFLEDGGELGLQVYVDDLLFFMFG